MMMSLGPKSLGEALITVTLLIVTTVLQIHAIILWLSANYKIMPFSVWVSYLFMTLLVQCRDA